jgi:hypothetical protein
MKIWAQRFVSRRLKIRFGNLRDTDFSSGCGKKKMVIAAKTVTNAIVQKLAKQKSKLRKWKSVLVSATAVVRVFTPLPLVVKLISVINNII